MSKPSSRERLIEIGLELFLRDGYGATGINQILEMTQLPKGSFYHHFKSKEEFAAEVLAHYVKVEGKRAEEMLMNRSLSPLERLRAYFLRMLEVHGRTSSAAGCLVGVLTQETAEQSPLLQKDSKAAFQGWQHILELTLQEAIDREELPVTRSAAETAAFLVDYWQGAQLRSKAEQSDAPLERFLSFVFEFVFNRVDR